MFEQYWVTCELFLAGESKLALKWKKTASKTDGLKKGRLEAGNLEKLVLWGEQRRWEDTGKAQQEGEKVETSRRQNCQNWAVVYMVGRVKSNPRRMLRFLERR